MDCKDVEEMLVGVQLKGTGCAVQSWREGITGA